MVKRLSTIRVFPLADLSRAQTEGNGKGLVSITMSTRKLLALCATISLAFVVALTLTAMAFNGSTSKNTSQSGKTLAATPVPPDDETDTGNVQIAATPVPPDDETDTGNVKIAATPVPPDDETDTGNVRIAATPVPPDDETDTGNVRIALVQVLNSARP